jgi:hypothetical protein
VIRRGRAMPRRAAAIAVLAGLAGWAAAAPAAADPRATTSPHWIDPASRTAYVARALAAVRGLGPTGCAELDRALYDAARARCRADAGTPAASCLVDAARAACAGAADRARCEAAADVIATNLRGQTALVDDATRFRLVRGSADYRTALAAELHRRYAVLAAELVLAGATGSGAATGDDARAIDELCANRDRALHACQAQDTACVPSLPWSRCVAALVWFVGGGP